MHDLQPVTPLGAALARVNRIGALEITERVDQALASLGLRNGGAWRPCHGGLAGGKGSPSRTRKEVLLWRSTLGDIPKLAR